MKRIFISLALGALITGGIAPALGHAQSWAPRYQNDQSTVPVSRVLNRLKARYGGYQLDVKQSGQEYRIRWLTKDGRVLNVRASMRDGSIISVRGG